MKPCPNCGSTDLNDRYVYVECNVCLMTGPKQNNGRNDEHADEFDHKIAVRNWNELPRNKTKKFFKED